MGFQTMNPAHFRGIVGGMDFQPMNPAHFTGIVGGMDFQPMNSAHVTGIVGGMGFQPMNPAHVTGRMPVPQITDGVISEAAPPPAPLIPCGPANQFSVF